MNGRSAPGLQKELDGLRDEAEVHERRIDLGCVNANTL